MSVRLVAIGLLVWSSAAAYATAQGPSQVEIADEIQARTGAKARLDATQTAGIPPGVVLANGLSRDEAVAVALWNNAAFQVSVSQLGFARADLADAGMIANPVLSLLFPWGPKQLEAAVRWPVEVLWERPRRMAAAELSLESAAKALVQSGLDLALSVRVAHTDLALAIDRGALGAEAAAALQRIATLTQSRLAAGDIAELEARTAQIDAIRSAQDAARAAHDVTIARERLRLLLGLAADDPALDIIEDGPEIDRCGSPADLIQQALAARPDVRAAELAVEAAAARGGWERSKILTLTAILDANGRGFDGFEAGPGVDVSLPLFNRNQGGRVRAEAELQRAAANYLALTRQVTFDVRESSALLDQARQSRQTWRDSLIAPLQSNLADAEKSYTSGESSFLFVLENSRRLIDARVRERDLAADEQRARARLERATGGACSASDRGAP